MCRRMRAIQCQPGMIVIVEGADLVGKSTLAASLARLHGWPIVKIRWALIGDPEIETRAMAASTIAILKATRPAVIFDRIYFSWWAYGPVLGYPIAYMPELIRAYEPVDDTRMVVLTASAEELERRYERQPDLYFSLDVIQAANERFRQLPEVLPRSLSCLNLDTTRNDIESVLSAVERFLAAPLP